jgi:hypothetical protein
MRFCLFACALCLAIEPRTALAAPSAKAASLRAKPLLVQTQNGVTLRVWRAHWAKARELSTMSSEPELALEYDIVAPKMKPDAGKSLSDYVLTARVQQDGWPNEGLALDSTKLFRSSNAGYLPPRPEAKPAGRGILVWRTDPRQERYDFAWEWVEPGTTWDKKASTTLDDSVLAGFRHFRFVLRRDQIEGLPARLELPTPLQEVQKGVYKLGLYRWTKSDDRAVADFIFQRNPATGVAPGLSVEATDQSGARLNESWLQSKGYWLFNGDAVQPGEIGLKLSVPLAPETQSVHWKVIATEQPGREAVFALDGLQVPKDHEPLTLNREFIAPNGARVIVKQILRFDAEHPLRYPERSSGPTLPINGLAVSLQITPSSPVGYVHLRRALARDNSGKRLSDAVTMRYPMGNDFISGQSGPGFQGTVLLLEPTAKAQTFNLRVRFFEMGEERRIELELPPLAAPER